MDAAWIVGRTAELAELHAVLDQLDAPPPSPAPACVILGEAGIGKSTVLNAVSSQARDRGHQVLTCRPSEADSALSYSGLIEFLDGVPDATLRRLPPPQAQALEVALLRAAPLALPLDQQAVSLALLNLVRLLAAGRPLVLAIDDTQWLDPATGRALSYAVRRLDREPVALLAAVRSRDAVDGRVPLDLDRLGPMDRLRRLHLGRLTPAQLHRLVRTRVGLVLARPNLLRLDRASGGNPLFALEISRILAITGLPGPGESLPVPRTLHEAVAGVVSSLPELTRQALLYSAASTHPTTQLLAAALNTGATANPAGLADAERAGVIEIRDRRVRFAHPLYASAVYGSASDSARRAVHRRLAEVVSELDQRARHLALATDDPDASTAEALEAAARDAHARGAPAMAAEFWDLACRRTPATDPASRQRRAVDGAVCLFSAGDGSGARALLERAVSAMPPGRERARALLWLGSVQFYDGNPRDAVAALQRGLAEAGTDPVLAGTLHLRIAWCADYDIDLRVSQAQAAHRLLDESDADPALRACATLAVAFFGFLAGHGVNRQLLDAGRTLLPEQDFSWEVEFARSTINLWAKNLDVVQAQEGWRNKYRRAHEIGDEPGVPHSLVHLVELECWLGNVDQAQRYAAELTDAVELVGQRRWWGLARYAAALVATHLGDVETALAVAGEGLAVAEELNDSVSLTLHRSVLGFLELSRGDPYAADRQLTQAGELVTAMGLAEPARFTFFGDQIEAALAIGARDRAGELLAVLEHRCAVAPYPWLLVVTARCRAQLALAYHDLDGAQLAMTIALRELENLPMPFEAARTKLVHGQILVQRNEFRAAHVALDEARTGFSRLTARLWVIRTSSELDRIGPQRRPVDQLTPAEARVVKLVIEGLTNDDVATALCLSRRTVESHLSRVYRKLGVRSRTELAFALARRA